MGPGAITHIFRFGGQGHLKSYLFSYNIFCLVVVVVVVVAVVVSETLSLCNLGCPRTLFVDQVCLELIDFCMPLLPTC